MRAPWLECIGVKEVILVISDRFTPCIHRCVAVVLALLQLSSRISGGVGGGLSLFVLSVRLLGALAVQAMVVAVFLSRPAQHSRRVASGSRASSTSATAPTAGMAAAAGHATPTASSAALEAGIESATSWDACLEGCQHFRDVLTREPHVRRRRAIFRVVPSAEAVEAEELVLQLGDRSEADFSVKRLHKGGGVTPCALDVPQVGDGNVCLIGLSTCGAHIAASVQAVVFVIRSRVKGWHPIFALVIESSKPISARGRAAALTRARRDSKAHLTTLKCCAPQAIKLCDNIATAPSARHSRRAGDRLVVEGSRTVRSGGLQQVVRHGSKGCRHLDRAEKLLSDSIHVTLQPSGHLIILLREDAVEGRDGPRIHPHVLGDREAVPLGFTRLLSEPIVRLAAFTAEHTHGHSGISCIGSGKPLRLRPQHRLEALVVLVLNEVGHRLAVAAHAALELGG